MLNFDGGLSYFNSSVMKKHGLHSNLHNRIASYTAFTTAGPIKVSFDIFTIFEVHTFL